jgi:putative NADPH-quinone reductase
MSKRVVIINGHPDAGHKHLGDALVAAYEAGAIAAGHEVRRVVVAELDFEILRSKDEWENGEPPPSIRQAQETIAWADHLVIFYPLWLGEMPALLKAFLEQVARPGFAFAKADSGRLGKKLLSGKSARIVVTMGMPALLYRWYYRAHGLKNLERNILGFVGIGPVDSTLLGLVEGGKAARREKWIAALRALGQKAG